MKILRVIFFICLNIFHCVLGSKQLNIGVLLSWKGVWPAAPGTAAAILLAFESLTNERNLLPGYNISWVWMDTECEANQAVSATLTLKDVYDIHAFIGPPCSISCTRTAQLAYFYKIPMISWAAASPLLSDKSNFPVFSRTVGPYTKMISICKKIMAHFGWQYAAILSSNDDLYSVVGEELLADMQASGYDVMFYQSFSAVTADVGSGSKVTWMTQLRSVGVRVIFALAYCSDMRDILLTAKDLGMIEGYMYLFFDIIEDCHVDSVGLNDGRDDEAKMLFDAVLSTTWYTITTEQYSIFLEKMDARRMEFAQYSYPPNGPLQPKDSTECQGPASDQEWIYASANDSTYEMPSVEETATMGRYASFLYDAIYMYYLLANETLAEGKDPRESGMEIVEKAKGFQFSGLSGDVVIDENGDRSPDILLNNIRIEGGSWHFDDVATYSASTDSLSVLIEDSEIRWPGGLDTVPIDYKVSLPECQTDDFHFTTSECDSYTSKRVIQFSWNNSVNCEGGISLPQPIVIECDYLPLKSAIFWGVLAVTLTGAITGACLNFAILYYRQSAVIRAAQPQMLHIFILSAVMVSLSFLVGVGEMTHAKCIARTCMFHLSFTSMFGSLFVKVYRVWRIFGNKEFKKVKITLLKTLQYLGAILSVDVFIMVLYFIFDPPLLDTTLLNISNSVPVEWRECHQSSTFDPLLAMYHVGMVLIGSVFSFQTRNMNSKYQESKYVMFAIYQIALLGGITWMVTSFEPGLGLKTLVGVVGWTVSCVGATCLVVAPKILRLLKPEWFPDDASNTGYLFKQRAPNSLEIKVVPSCENFQESKGSPERTRDKIMMVQNKKMNSIKRPSELHLLRKSSACVAPDVNKAPHNNP